MEFCKPAFVGFFLAVFLIYWWLQKHGWRMAWLLLASGIYYATFNPWFLLLLLGSTSIDYFVALRLPKTTSLFRRRALLWLSITVNLSILAFFKYLLFAMQTTSIMADWFGWSFTPPAWKLILPLGISFYTFEAISYVVDVYKGKIAPLTSPRDYLLYILFFPHLLAGPIVRSGDFAHQLHRTKHFSWLRLEVGVRLFVLGLFKKAVLADWMASLVDPVFTSPGSYSTPALWFATFAYAVQIYGDFSGYSDMAIGLAHMLGFKLPANFNMPYLATSIGDFWRRWHISLSSWLRDYLYIPLGGNRQGEWFTYRNLLFTMTLGGLWHGASWTFVLWGVFHGSLLVLERLIPIPRFLKSRWFQPGWVALTFVTVCLGWVLFRAQTFADAGVILTGLFVPVQGKSFTPEEALMVICSLAAVFTGNLFASVFNIRKFQERIPLPIAAAGLATFVLIYLLLLPPKSSGFIYFQF